MNEWAEYLAVGAWRNDSAKIYHMCEVPRFDEFIMRNSQYYSPTYHQDGFIHATADANLLMKVANHFYVDSRDDWVCLEIDPKFLNCKVIYEAPAPVGDKPSNLGNKDEEKNDSLQSSNVQLFPHIYGGINKLAVTRVMKIVRDGSGKFVSIEGIDRL